MAIKRRIAINLFTKLKIISEIADGKSYQKVADVYKQPRQTVISIYKNRDAILKNKALILTTISYYELTNNEISKSWRALGLQIMSVNGDVNDISEDVEMIDDNLLMKRCDDLNISLKECVIDGSHKSNPYFEHNFWEERSIDFDDS
ncbi:hypothetical protein A3Q56_06122 [Intoshia linei]|uniref:Uncharacterized protein n=1 Tax=Intoshia linei TaxID=1819745 RepID=A0A177AVZ7_9BILA|nr:hypothetical protein A3Q56_06122 [Intoshia linei]